MMIYSFCNSKTVLRKKTITTASIRTHPAPPPIATPTVSPILLVGVVDGQGNKTAISNLSTQ